MAKKPRNAPQVRVPVTPAERQQIEDLATRLKISRSEVLRRGLPLLLAQVENAEAGGPPDITMGGDSTTLAAKNLALQSIRSGKGIAMAAQDAGVTVRTVEFWSEKDPVFAQLAYESKAHFVESVEQTLLALASGHKGKSPNVTACLAYLNANHPDYGVMRQQSAERLLEEVVNGVLDVAERLLPPDNLDAFTEAIVRHSRAVISQAGTKKR